MTLQEEIVQLHEQIKKMEKLAVQRARRSAIGFGVIAIIALISFVYAFVQHEKSQQQQELAIQKERIALLAEEDAIRSRDKAEFCQHELSTCRASQK